MDKEKEYAKKVTEESASFLESAKGIFDVMEQLWELEKTMYNRAAEEAGMSPIKDSDEQEEDGSADDEERAGGS
jgi:hypothetical protein